jgi:hypothetical protein
MDFTTLGLVGSLATGPLAFWLRLRWRVRQEQARGAYLIGIAQALPRGGRFDGQCGDGTRLRLVVNGSSEHE